MSSSLGTIVKEELCTSSSLVSLSVGLTRGIECQLSVMWCLISICWREGKVVPRELMAPGSILAENARDVSLATAPGSTTTDEDMETEEEENPSRANLAAYESYGVAFRRWQMRVDSRHAGSGNSRSSPLGAAQHLSEAAVESREGHQWHSGDQE